LCRFSSSVMDAMGFLILLFWVVVLVAFPLPLGLCLEVIVRFMRTSGFKDAQGPRHQGGVGKAVELPILLFARVVTPHGKHSPRLAEETGRVPVDVGQAGYGAGAPPHLGHGTLVEHPPAVLVCLGHKRMAMDGTDDELAMAKPLPADFQELLDDG